MRIARALERTLMFYIREKVDRDVQCISDWSQRHPDGCFGAEECKCYQTAQIHVEYIIQDGNFQYVPATWIFEGTLGALIKMLDAFEEMEAK